MERKPVRLLLVDDQKLFVDSLKYVLENMAKDFQVVGVAASGVEALDLTARLIPDLVLMDVRMPGMDGVEATRVLRGRFPQVRIVILTTFGDDEYVHEAVRLGAAGYLLKNMPPEALISSLQSVMQGATSFAKEIVGSAVAGREEDDEISRLLRTVSPREMEVLTLVMNSWNNQEIAEHLSISAQSVRNYTHRIYERFAVADRLQLMRTLSGRWKKS